MTTAVIGAAKIVPFELSNSPRAIIRHLLPAKLWSNVLSVYTGNRFAVSMDMPF